MSPDASRRSPPKLAPTDRTSRLDARGERHPRTDPTLIITVLARLGLPCRRSDCRPGGTGALSLRRSRPYCGPERRAVRSACPLVAPTTTAASAASAALLP